MDALNCPEVSFVPVRMFPSTVMGEGESTPWLSSGKGRFGVYVLTKFYRISLFSGQR